MEPQRFKSTIARSSTRAAIPIPFDPDSVWGAKDRHHISGTVNDCKVRGRLESDTTGWFLVLGPAWRRDNHLDVGAEVQVVLEPEGPQGERLSSDVRDAMSSDPTARGFFESLPTFYRKNYIRWIESAKRPETRANRIAEMMRLLKAGKREK